MLFKLGFALLFFLPIIESFDRNTGSNILIISSLILGFSSLRRLKLINDWIGIIWIMMLTVFTVSAVFSWSIARSYIELSRYFAYFLIFLTFRNYTDKQNLIRYFLVPMVIINSLILLILYFLYSLPFIHSPFVLDGMNLVLPTFGHNRISDLLVFTIPVAIAVYQNANGKFRRLIFLLLPLFFLLILVLSQGRGAILSLSLAFFILLFLKKGLTEEKKKYYIWVLGISVLAIFILSASFIYSNLIPKDVDAPAGFYKPAIKEERLEFFRQALTGLASSPIFGTGLDTFRYISAKYQSGRHFSWYTHNHFLEIFQETGIVGGSLFLIMIFTLLIRGIKVIRGKEDTGEKKGYESALFIGMMASSLQSLIDYNWQYLSVFLIFWMSSCLILPDPGKLIQKKISFGTVIMLIILILFCFTNGFIQIKYDQKSKTANQLFFNSKYREALPLLLQNNEIDKLNYSLIRQIGEIYSYTDDPDNAHFWFHRSIVLNPLESEGTIRSDLLLYLKQARIEADKDLNKSVSTMNELMKIYNVIYQENRNLIIEMNKKLNSGDEKGMKDIYSKFLNNAEKILINRKLTDTDKKIIAKTIDLYYPFDMLKYNEQKSP